MDGTAHQPVELFRDEDSSVASSVVDHATTQDVAMGLRALRTATRLRTGSGATSNLTSTTSGSPGLSALDADDSKQERGSRRLDRSKCLLSDGDN